MNVPKTPQPKLEEIQKLLSQQKIKAASTLLQELFTQRPNDSKVLVLLGLAASKQNHTEKAEHYFLQAIQENKNDADAHFNLATLYLNQGKFNQAIQEYQKVNAFDAIHLQAEIKLGEAFENNWRFFEAEVVYQRVLQEEPQNATILERLASVQRKLGKIEESIQCSLKALDISPKSVTILNHLAFTYQENNDTAKAVATFEKVLALKPRNAMAYYGLAQSDSKKNALAIVTKIEALLEHYPLKSNDKILLHFALGKIEDENDNNDNAFSHFKTANTIYAKQDPFEIQRFIENTTRIIQTFSAKFIHEKKIAPEGEKIPIFIIGMSESGKKLVENALTLHPRIAKTGEQRVLWELVKDAWHHPSLMHEWESTDLVKMAQNYLQTLSHLALKEASFFCDAMPNNHLLLGMIEILFPEAKIIHCTRHPLDLCLANYTHYKETPCGYAHNLTMLGKYYQQDAKLMGYWQSIGVNHRIEIKYEDLVSSPKETLAKLFTFLDLPFAADSFHIPSFHTREVGRWQKYQSYLRPLIEQVYKKSF